MMLGFFGPRWDAPIVDNARQLPTPVGAACMRCSGEIAGADRGLIMYGVKGRPKPGGPPDLEALAVHAECEMVPNIGHVYGVCTCRGWDTSDRKTGQALWVAVGAQRGRSLDDRVDGRHLDPLPDPLPGVGRPLHDRLAAYVKAAHDAE